MEIIPSSTTTMSNQLYFIDETIGISVFYVGIKLIIECYVLYYIALSLLYIIRRFIHL